MSIIKANNWQDLNDNVMTPFVQAVTAQKTDTFYSSSTAWVDITGLSVTITPTRTTSRIILFIHVSMSMVSGHGGVRLVRNGNPIGVGDAMGSRNQATFWDYGTSSYNTAGYTSHAKPMTWVDYPNSVAAVTYKLQYANPYSSSYSCGINYNAYDNADNSWNYSTVSSITAVEAL